MTLHGHEIVEGLPPKKLCHWTPTRSQVALLFSVAGLFLLACFCPAVQMAGEGFALKGPWNEVHIGLIALLFGWLSHLGIHWLANVLLMAGWWAVVLKAYQTATLLAGTAFVLTLATEVHLVESYKVIPPDRGLTGLYAGYYLWLASMLVLACGAEWLAIRRWMLQTGAPQSPDRRL